MRVTRRAIEKALVLAGISDPADPITVEQFHGFWYFTGGKADGWYSAAADVTRLSDMTIWQWILTAAYKDSDIDRYAVSREEADTIASAAINRYLAMSRRA